jgi:hypothetical protein
MPQRSFAFDRRRFLSSALGVAAAAPLSQLLRPSGPTFAAGPETSLPGDIEKIEHLGRLFDACTLPGETRADGVVPRHANALQLRHDRWLVVYSTHGYRGVDDERSIVYQIRADAPDGRLLKEGFLSQGRADWQPDDFDLKLLKPNQTVYKQHGHMVPFGVPQGALIDGRTPPHAGLFVVKWRTSGRILNRDTDYLEHRSAAPTGDGRIGQRVEWVQFRLNEAGDDLAIVQAVRPLRQRGYETGPRFTASDDVAWMNQSFVPAVPFNADATEWIDVNHVDEGRIAAMKYRFDPARGVYDWVEIGPRLSTPDGHIHEAGIARIGNGWALSARRQKGSGVAWFRTSDPFGETPTAIVPEQPQCNAPLTAFVCADGVLRLFTGDGKASPHRNARDPLYMWDVDADGRFEAKNRRTIFDSVAAGLPIRPAVVPKIDFCELFPHHDRTQLIVHGVSTRGYNFSYVNRPDIPAINAAEKEAAGIYYARITYRHEPPPRWKFADES